MMLSIMQDTGMCTVCIMATVYQCVSSIALSQVVSDGFVPLLIDTIQMLCVCHLWMACHIAMSFVDNVYVMSLFVHVTLIIHFVSLIIELLEYRCD